MRSRVKWCVLYALLAGLQLPNPSAAQTTAAPQGTRPDAVADGGEILTLTFAENTRLKVLIDFVSERLGVQFLYDDQVTQQVVTIKQGLKVRQEGLLEFLQLVLKAKGYAITDLGRPGWKQIVPAGQMTTAARPVIGPATRPTEAAITQIFHLEHFDGVRLEALLRPFLSQPGGTVISVPEQRLLIVTDYASNVARLATLIGAVDKERRAVATDVVPLQYADASEVATKVTTAMQARITAAGQSPAAADTVDVAFDARTNSLVLIGAQERIDQATAVARQFDTPAPFVTRTYRFEHVSPERVDRMIRQLIDGGVLKRSYQAGVDKEARLMVVTAPPAIQARVEQLKQEMDVPAAVADSPIQFYKLSNTAARDVLATLLSIQGKGSDGDFGSVEPPAAGEDGARANPLSRRTHSGGGRSTMAGMDGRLQPQGLAQEPGPSEEQSAGRGGRASRGATTQPAGAGEGTQGGGFQAGDATVSADVNTNSIIVVAEPSVQKVYERLIRMLDKRRPQVLVECTLVILDTSRNFSLGVDVGVPGGVGSAELITFSNFGVGVPHTDDGSATGRLAIVPGAGFNGALLSPDVADIVLRALLTNSRARVVSAPRILVNDNATGSLQSTAEQPYSSINIGNTVSTTTFGAYAEAGTTITLTPHISEADYLQLEYEVALNQFTGAATAGNPPPRQTNALASTVTIPDGSTIIIGGLNSTSYSKTANTIPLLGELPVLKDILGTHAENRARTTLFVFIRPMILRDDRFADLKYVSERAGARAGLSADDPASEPMTLH